MLTFWLQVNMPVDSFESPLTLAACGGHVELADLLIERGANIEEVNDEGYTPLMEAAREGHGEMVALLLSHGKEFSAFGISKAFQSFIFKMNDPMQAVWNTFDFVLHRVQQVQLLWHGLSFGYHGWLQNMDCLCCPEAYK